VFVHKCVSSGSRCYPGTLKCEIETGYERSTRNTHVPPQVLSWCVFIDNNCVYTILCVKVRFLSYLKTLQQGES
jgi:hypothetical protein